MARNDMRIDIDFVDHPKTKRLIRKAGFEGFYCLIKLFSVAAKIYQDGKLKNCDSLDIEDICGWTGEEGVLFSALIDDKIKFIEEIGGEYFIHDWEDNQPWIYHAQERSEIARSNAKCRTYPKQDDAVSKQLASKQQTVGNAPSPSPSPSPIPSPSPSQECNTVSNEPKHTQKRFIKPTIFEVTAYCKERGNTVNPQKFIAFYDSKGWKIGKNTMISWKSAIVTWELNDKKDGNKTNESYDLDMGGYQTI